MSERAQRRRALALGALLALALLLRLAAALAAGERELRGDEGYYVGAATEIRDHGTHPGAFRPPGYAAFVAAVLWLTGDGLGAVRWAQALLSLVVIVAVFDIAQRRFGTGPATVSALLCATSPTLVHYTQTFWSETLVTTGLCLLVWSFDVLDRNGRTAWAVVTGLVLGLSALTREMYLYFAPLVALCLVLGPRDQRRRRVRHGALLLGTSCLVLLPWAVRNYQAYGRFELSTNRWYPIALGTLPARDGTLLGLPDERRLIAAYNEIDDPAAAEEMARGLAVTQIVAQQPWWIFRKAVRSTYFLFAPVSQLTRFVERGWLLADHPGYGRWLVRAELAHYVVLMLLGIGGLWLVPGGRTQLLVAALVLFHLAIYVIANANHRFRVPLLPLFALYAGPMAYLRIARGPYQRARMFGAAACGAAFVLIVGAGGELHTGRRHAAEPPVADPLDDGQ